MTVNTAANAVRVTGAASHITTEWHAINWQKAHRNVRRLQARSAIRSLETVFQDGG
jgi:hypothetical protein